jgi:hypothetical protein
MANNKKYTYLPFLIIIAVLVFAHSSLFAEDTVKELIAKNYKETKDISVVVKKLIKEGVDTKDVVMKSIQLGHDACLVIRSAIEAEGDLEQIIAGALAGGATADVCSRCMVDAGIDPARAALAFETGPSQIDMALPGHTRGGGFVSPHSFE